MNVLALVLLVFVAAGVMAVLRRRHAPHERRREVAERRDDWMKVVEAYSFPVLGGLIVIGALVYWDPWLSMAGLAIGGLFLFAGLASLREIRRRRAG